VSRYRRYESGRGLDYYRADPNVAFVLDGLLPPAVRRWADEPLERWGQRCGTDIVRRADATDRRGHELIRYDRFGNDVSEIAYHPDWLANLDEAFDFGLVGWNYDDALLARYGRAPVPLLAAFDYMAGQAEMALCCPVELAHGAVVVLERFASAELRRRWLPAVTATEASRRLQTAQVVTEITGGSDVGASRTRARRHGDRWLLSGEKWFASNCGADLIFTLARVDSRGRGTAGLGFFVVPRQRDDGRRNGVRIRRLKDKMGTIGVPTGELELVDAEAYLVGEAGEGFAYMAEMLNHTRFWNAVGALGVMRRAFLEAAVYAARRTSFGRTIDSFPMVAEQLVWLCVDLEATTALVFEAAAALEAANAGDAAARLRFRTLAPVVKYRTGEQGVAFARAAVEMLAGNGYVADFGTPRLLRDAQVNTIWEGTSNICALDVWRAISAARGHEALIARGEQLLAGITTEAAARVADAAGRALKDAGEAVGYLEGAGEARVAQQARRLTDVVGDALALCLLAAEADRAAAGGDHRKALVGELFARRAATPAAGLTAVTTGFTGVPDCYPALVADGGCPAEEHRRAREALGRP
jgi:alkylation response protein AidB-like acyl-CoA dehydrogenase